jgi:hypothetical protein
MNNMGDKLLSNDKETQTPFARYRDGYVDGYEGNPKRFDQDIEYTRGYNDGYEDDREGAQKRFDATDVKPVSPAMINLLRK